MNLVILEPADFIADNLARLSDRRLQHLLDVHRVTTGDTLKAGVLDGAMGTATVLRLNSDSIELETHIKEKPPKPLAITLILALPRPRMLGRILQTIATMGVKKLYLVNSYRVEKSYWQTPLLEPTAIRKQLILGLEQGCDSILPEVILKKRFKPFVEDELRDIVADSTALVAHPKSTSSCPVAHNSPITLAIGPEGGFIDYEIEKLQEIKFNTVNLGSRILKVETAVPVLLSRLFTR